MTAIDDAALEAGRLLFAGPIAFERGVAKLADLPPGDVPEVAFAGRSNVGKSSLINALTNRRALARASAEPGRTRELNYFRIGETLRLVDLPGYGYARAPKTEIARWTALMRDFLRGRAELKRVFLLVDARHGLKESDLEIAASLDAAAVNHQIVLTKADKISGPALAARIAETAAALARRPAAHPEVLATSAETGAGIPALRAVIATLCGAV
ncbi:MAG: ribosome biogenesis GTP-binding protein YihA/YsxC [Hyphomonadaceae bacterium]|nr:ribosome biogenesis GTP-binding protein YihA/YsxC [Hyphomonadaceae bacterium]